MNCEEYQEWWQRRLDGDRASLEEAAEMHSTGCSSCTRLHDSMLRLEAGLRSVITPVPPAHLSGLIVRQVLAERRSLRRRRVLTYAAALAACLLIAFLAGRRSVTPEAPNPDYANKKDAVEPKPVPDQPRLNDQVGEAGTALAALFTRTADETVGQGRLLLPESMTPPKTDMPAWPQTLEPPVQSLYDAGQGVSSGLEPVTSSARRAVSLFMRDIPPITPGMQ